MKASYGIVAAVAVLTSAAAGEDALAQTIQIRPNLELEWSGQPPPSARRSPDRVKFVQSRLAALGYYSGPQHGKLDDGTREAIRRFQQAVGLPVNAELSIELHEQLQSEYDLCVVARSLAADPASIARTCKNRSSDAPK
jgi:peptidoglycan hydrolase-like protein with peptidoglycan-binding domain